MDWREKRSRIRIDVANAFSERSGISREDFLEVFYDAAAPPPMGDFTAQYLADEDALDAIFSEIADLTGLDESKARIHFHPEESFPQYAEHLLRAGAHT